MCYGKLREDKESFLLLMVAISSLADVLVETRMAVKYAGEKKIKNWCE